jgi:hypothetical protein
MKRGIQKKFLTFLKNSGKSVKKKPFPCKNCITFGEAG